MSHINPTVLPKAMAMQATHGLNNVSRIHFEMYPYFYMKWEKYQFEQYVQVVMLTWRAQM